MNMKSLKMQVKLCLFTLLLGQWKESYAQSENSKIKVNALQIVFVAAVSTAIKKVALAINVVANFAGGGTKIKYLWTTG